MNATRGGQLAFERAGPMLAAVLAVAVMIRWLAYTGFFGSDEVTYTHAAFRIVDGDWRVDEYVGANRLGVNLPVAALGWAFGKSEFSAALWSLMTSTLEVGLVAWIGARMFGVRAGAIAGLLLATLPSHVHFGGRLMADAPLCAAITAAFVMFYVAETRRWPLGFFLAGVCAGLAFWVKPAVVFVFGIFLAYPLVARRWDWHWLWMGAGLFAAIAANGLVFLALTGDFLFTFNVTRDRSASGFLEEGVAAGQIAVEPFFYLTYMFGKVYHTGLVGLLWLLAAVIWWRRGRPEEVAPGRFLLFWGVGLWAILSLLPVSFSPLIFVPKQTNYMLIFVAPLCVMAGYGLSRLSSRLQVAGTTAACAIGVGFALLLQANVAVFTANSWATLEFVDRTPQGRIAVMSNAYRAATFRHVLGGPDVSARIMPLGDFDAAGAEHVVIDPQTFDWDRSVTFRDPSALPVCWVRQEELTGQPAGYGAMLARTVLALLPGSDPFGIATRLRSLTVPNPAVVYRVPTAGC